MGSSNSCWDTNGVSVGGNVATSQCQGFGGSQEFRLNINGQIGVGERCILAQGAGSLHVSYCPTEPSGPWNWDETTGLIRHTDLNKCVADRSGHRLSLQFCNEKDSDMKWTIKELYPWKTQ